jgi:Ca2+/Na+ antiporter
MNLTHVNLILLGVGCTLLLVGFSGRQYRWATAVMMVGILCILFMIGYNIRELLHRP